MPAPATVDEFLELIQKSGVVDEAKLTAYLNRQKELGPLPTETNKAAGKFVRDAVLTYFQAEQLLQGKWKRFTIGKYKVLEKLGVGGMGQVFLCEHKLMRRRVAVKVLPASKGVDDASRERFYLEARAVAALDHPNIVRAYDIDQDEGLHFLVMEFVDGVNLQDIVKRGGLLDPVRACHYIYGAATGLQYASQMGIVHRDIKPGNILVDRAGVVKILDMGLARFFHDEDDSLTKKYDENVLGTADYLAPEQAVDSHSVTIRADLYSLGGTFYYLLTGLPPFPEGSVAQKLLWHQTRDPKPVALIRPEVPAEIVRVVEKLMMKDPDDRYQTPTEVMAALQEFVQVPISPPTEKELPNLSPAAMGNAAAAANRSVTTAPLAGGGPNGVTSQSTAEFRSPVARTSPGGGSSRDKLLNTPSPSKPPAAVADTPVGVWDSLGEDTSPREGADTQRTPKSAKKQRSAKKLPTPASPAPGSPRRKKYLWAGVAAGVVAVLGIGYAVVRPSGGGTVAPQATQLDYRRVYVTQGKGPDNAPAFKSVREALLAINKRPEFDEANRKGGDGPTIVLLDDTHVETIFIGATGKLKDLTIQAENPAKPVRWSAKGGGTAKSLLEVRPSQGLVVRGVVFDAENAVDFGLVVKGSQSGLRFEDVTVRGAKRSAVRFESAGGEAGKPITLNRVRVQLTADGDGGVQFAGPEKGPGAATSANASIAITNSRIEGPGNVGVIIDTPVRDVEISRTRFYDLAQGVAVRQPFAADAAFRLTVTNNTFHTMREGAFVADAHDLPPAAEVTFTRNYFANVKGAGVASAKNMAALAKFKAADNVRDKDSVEGNLTAKPAVAENFTLPPPKPDDNATFLRPPRSSPLAAWGPAKIPVGVPPE